MKPLLPCPFCGAGTTQLVENGKVWGGMRYSEPVSVSVKHWCSPLPGPSRVIERIGRDEEEAIGRWNLRAGVEESGPWKAGVEEDRVFVQSEDFSHDVRLYITGDFADHSQRVAYAEEIARRLNQKP